MARIRSVKPSFWSDGAVASVSRDARLLMIGLISSADDHGRFLASANAIIGFVYPHDDITTSRVSKWLRELEKAGVLGLYEVDGLRYGYFPKWKSHQRISHPQPSSLPSPQGELFTS